MRTGISDSAPIAAVASQPKKIAPPKQAEKPPSKLPESPQITALREANETGAIAVQVCP